MPKMRSRNVRTSDRGLNNQSVNEYLICGKRHNQPRIHHRICEEACRSKKRCVYYKSWYESFHAEELLKAKQEAKKQKEEAKLLKESVKKPRKRKIKRMKRVRKTKTREA